MATVLSGYETVFITRPEMSDAQYGELQERVKGAIKGFGGDTVLSEDWGSRRMAYKIQKESNGRYTYIVYTGKGDVVAEVERNLRLNDQVLRFVSVNIASEFVMAEFEKRRETMKVQAKKREEEREARREERFKSRYDEDGGDY